jgi:hypothetical protein
MCSLGQLLSLPHKAQEQQERRPTLISLIRVHSRPFAVPILLPALPGLPRRFRRLRSKRPSVFISVHRWFIIARPSIRIGGRPPTPSRSSPAPRLISGIPPHMRLRGKGLRPLAFGCYTMRRNHLRIPLSGIMLIFPDGIGFASDENRAIPSPEHGSVCLKPECCADGAADGRRYL